MKQLPLEAAAARHAVNVAWKPQPLLRALQYLAWIWRLRTTLMLLLAVSSNLSWAWIPRRWPRRWWLPEPAPSSESQALALPEWLGQQ